VGQDSKLAPKKIARKILGKFLATLAASRGKEDLPGAIIVGRKWQKAFEFFCVLMLVFALLRKP
jgi:hypothetical protein